MYIIQSEKYCRKKYGKTFDWDTCIVEVFTPPSYIGMLEETASQWEIYHKVIEVDHRSLHYNYNETKKVVQMTADNCIYDHGELIGFFYRNEYFLFSKHVGEEREIEWDRSVSRTGPGIYDWDYIKTGTGILRRVSTSEN